MKSSPYLDIHTHRKIIDDSTVAVGSMSVEDILMQNHSVTFSTAGIHPWWLEDYSPEEIDNLKSKIAIMLEQNKLWGLGETGIDRAVPEFLELQQELFDWHILLSEKYRLPLIIHNVRAGSDILEKLKKVKPLSPWIFHDFRGSEELALSILRLHPKSYFSFGISIDNSEKTRQTLAQMPVENVFLETDAQKHLNIHDIYLRASEIMGMDIEFLKSQLWLNFNKLSPRTH